MNYCPQGLLIMTALVPTAGHEYAIRMANEFMDRIGGVINVIVFDRTFEPVRGSLRASAIKEQFANESSVLVYTNVDDGAPQNDDGTQEFWDYWTNMARTVTGVNDFQYIFASEAYGSKYADAFGAQFIPIDIDREVIPIKGTTVRHNLKMLWPYVMPSFKKHLAKRVTFFGAESTGKTTMANIFAKDNRHGGLFLHEWARPYLERFGPEVTDQRMDNITLGEYAALKAVINNTMTSPIVYQDTDLLSTIGYYRIYKGKSRWDIEEMFRETQSDLYVVMNSGIKFTPDPLRYGGEVRESSDQFWIDLLDEFGCNYYVVRGTGSAYSQFEEIREAMADFEFKAWGGIANFKRD